MSRTKLCITCRFYNDYFTRHCDNPASLNHGEEMEPHCVCKDWAPSKGGDTNDTCRTAPPEARTE